MGIVYRPIKREKGREEIRLLDLESASGIDKPLRGTLRHAQLHEAKYCALSYVWGQVEDDRWDITIRHERSTRDYFSSKLHRHSGSTTDTHSLGSSLAAALRHLRQKYGRVVIWADALCINQEDEDEKSWQVSLMNSVYSNAKEVHAWLGPQYKEDVNVVSNINAAFKLASTVWNLARQIKDTQSILVEQNWLEACFTVASPDQSSDEAQRAWTEFSSKLRQAALSDRAIRSGLTCVKALSQNAYFSRIWILQETGRAGRLTFHWGLRDQPHQSILLTLGLANYVRESQASSQLGQQLQGFDPRFLGCLTARTTCAQRRSLREVLEGAYYSPPPRHGATNLRDLVYARRGLAADPTGIKVDYTLSIGEVYTMASRFLFAEGFMEPLVSFRPYRSRQALPVESLPSWAYDWSMKGSNDFDRFSAAEGTTPEVSITLSHDTKFKQALTMTGVNIGSVRATRNKFSASAIAAGLHPNTIKVCSLRAVSESLSREKQQIITHKINEAYRQLGVDNANEDIDFLLSYRSLPFASFWCWWVHWVASLMDMIQDNDRKSSESIAELLFRKVPEALDNTSRIRQFGTRTGLLALVDYQFWSKLLLSENQGQNGTNDGVAVQFAESLFKSAWGMRPAVLDTGRLGYVPEDAQQQDQVVIFYGVKAPLVIRKVTQDAYRIIGPAHVAGAMQGQLMSAGLHDTTFKLV